MDNLKRNNVNHLLAGKEINMEPQGKVVRAKYDFAVAYPDPDSLPLYELSESIRTAILAEGKELAVYPHPDGYPPLRDFVASKLSKDRGIVVSPDDIILADGSSQTIHMAVESLVDPEDVVFTEEFVYSGTLRTLRRFSADVRGVKCDHDGMLIDALEDSINNVKAERKTPKLIYTIPTFQNPMGWTMPLSRRQSLIEIAKKYGILILEDDCYVDLRYEGTPVTSIHSLDNNNGQVIYVGSFSKIIAPGMRLGYITASPEILRRSRIVKSGAGVNQFAALAVHRYATSNLDKHIHDINKIQEDKRDAMLSALSENLGPIGSWSHPAGGLYIWLELPDDTDLVSAQLPASDAGVGYLPGTVFAPDGVSGKNKARLCFGYNNTSDIHEGISKLVDVFDKLGFLNR